MTYFTGDIHGDAKGLASFVERVKPSPDDVIVLLGDVGANFYMDRQDHLLKAFLNDIGPTVLCIHGNHEARPTSIWGYEERVWNGGIVYVQPEYPQLLFARDGEIFTINGIRYLVIGGAYSVDKDYRLMHGWNWWEDEQPSDEIKAYVEAQIAEKEFDVILSHTCPFKYEPREAFLDFIESSTVDSSTEHWLDRIEETVDYKAWFCGHWHIDKRIDRMHFLFHSFESDEQFSRKQEM